MLRVRAKVERPDTPRNYLPESKDSFRCVESLLDFLTIRGRKKREIRGQPSGKGTAVFCLPGKGCCSSGGLDIQLGASCTPGSKFGCGRFPSTSLTTSKPRS